MAVVDQRFWGPLAAAVVVALASLAATVDQHKEEMPTPDAQELRRQVDRTDRLAVLLTGAEMAVGRACLEQGVAREFKTKTLPPQVALLDVPSTETLM